MLRELTFSSARMGLYGNHAVLRLMLFEISKLKWRVEPIRNYLVGPGQKGTSPTSLCVCVCRVSCACRVSCVYVCAV